MHKKIIRKGAQAHKKLSTNEIAVYRRAIDVEQQRKAARKRRRRQMILLSSRKRKGSDERARGLRRIIKRQAARKLEMVNEEVEKGSRENCWWCGVGMSAATSGASSSSMWPLERKASTYFRIRTIRISRISRADRAPALAAFAPRKNCSCPSPFPFVI